MDFCTPDQTKQFLNGVPWVERAMVQSGIILLKYWLEVSPEEQERVRLNLISHILEQIPYKAVAAKKVTLPKRKVAAGKARHPFKYVPERF